ncbi:hypothetical protein CANINC_000995 [Pichia inconspicua]|uniref:Uncharacterized protein n=1 Tax=Pichia inconspicua TaxID=52247 RepID=A0A4V4NG32_9ASCO|nr:hypothetical protein CANINC_000995 [[Candida] inconspicua]
MKLKLDFSTPKVVDILVYHCSNIEGTFISDDDSSKFDIDYRSIDGIPYLCWKDEKIKLIRGDNLIYIPPSLFVMEKVSVAGIHEALGHIDTNVAEKSVKEGFIQVDESD